MAFPPRFLEELRNKITLSQIIGQKIKLTKRNRDFVGLCPFHKEKTPSFSVSDERGFYHCFGCGAHGDAISFLMGTEKLNFMEAVERLAHHAGMEMPHQSEEDKRHFERQTSLYAIMEKACQFFQNQLYKPCGQKALQYLKNRGLSDDMISHFRLGYAPTGNLLRQTLLRDGCSEKDLMDLGLVCKSKNAGQDNYDYFRDRVMFSITDLKGHIIAFGGRVLDKSEPKYLNSPETNLFHKGENLYAYWQSLDSIRKTGNVVLVEGYMDVIALHMAGITNAVAPLGTALTENQIEILWRHAKEPVICFDGDAAGRKAAERACKRVLPILKEGHSLRFVWLPEGLDPDDFVRAKGRDEMDNLFRSNKTLSWFLWNNAVEGGDFTTPEKRAMLEKDMMDTCAQIKNPSVRSYYEKEMQANLKTFTHDLLRKNPNSQKHTSTMIQVENVPVLQPHLSDMKMLLAYIVSYPDICGSYLENLSAIKMSDKKVLRLLEILTTELSDDVKISSEEFAKLLEEKYSKNIFIYLSGELEMLKRAERTPQTIKEEMQSRITALQLNVLEDDIKSLMAEFSKTPTSELWAQILALKQEKEKLKEMI